MPQKPQGWGEAELDTCNQLPKEWVREGVGSPVGTRLHQSLGTSTTCPGRFASLAGLSGPGQTPLAVPEGILFCRGEERLL